MPDQAAIVQELYNRMATLPPDKAAIVQELARRFQVGGSTPGGAPPDAGAQMRASALGKTGAAMDDSTAPTDISVPLHPYGGAPVLHRPLGEGVEDLPSRGFDTALQGVAQMGLGAQQENTNGVGDALRRGALMSVGLAPNRNIAGGGSKLIRGAGQAFSPTLAAAGVAAPLATALGLGSGSAAQAATEATLKAAGVPDEYSDSIGDTLGFVGGAVGPHVLAKLPGAIAAKLPPIGLGTHLDPTEAAAVQYGRDAGVQMRTSTLTGSKVALGAEKLGSHLPLMDSVAEDARTKEVSTLGAAGKRDLDAMGNGGTPATSLDAGESLQQQVLDNHKAQAVKADDSYNLLKSIENQPQFKANLQTGTRRVEAGLDDIGNPTYKDVPEMEDVQLPVDYRPMKAAVKPMLADHRRGMTIAQKESDDGGAAMQTIMDSNDFVSASVADRDLGAMKGIIRDSPQSTSVGQVKFAADKLTKAVDDAVARAGPDATAALKAGRESTVAKYESQDLQKSLGFKDVGTTKVEPGEPVAMVSKLTQPADRSIKLLRRVADAHPEAVPAIRQSVFQDLLKDVTADADRDKPVTALTRWNSLGAETKKVLFADAPAGSADRVTNFLNLAAMQAKNPNPSGTGSAIALMKGIGMIITAPFTLGAYIIGAKPLARMLYDPLAGKNLIAGMKTSPGSPGAALLAKNIIAAAGPEAVPVPVAGAPASVPTSTSGTSQPGAASQVAPIPGTPTAGAATSAASGAGRSADTVLEVPGSSGPGYQAQYKLRELAELNASHNGNTFQANPTYPHANQRDYSNAVNQGKIISGASRAQFKPSLHITDNPDATNGPIVTDAKGTVYGGNGRKMMLDRVYAGNPNGAAAYRARLVERAGDYGVDPKVAAGMKQPVLTREIPDAEFAARGPNAHQNAIADFNVKGTAELTPAERTISDSRRVSPATLDDIAGRLDAKGANATVGDVLQGKAGGEVLSKLVSDGVVSSQEQAAFVGKDGELTPAGKARISSLMIGRFFKDPAHLETVAPEIRNRIERIAAPLAQVEGDKAWNLTPEVQNALDLIERARDVGNKNLDDFIRTDGLFGTQKYSREAIILAKAIKSGKSADLTAGARQYAQDAAFASKGAGLMGDAPTPASSFADAFEHPPEPPPPANALAPKPDAPLKVKSVRVKKPKPANSLSKKPE